MCGTRTAIWWSAQLLGLTILLGGCGSGGDGAAGVDGTAPVAPGAGATLFADPFDDDHNGWALPENNDARTTFADGDFLWEAKRAANLRPHVNAASLGDAFDRGELRMRDVVVQAAFTPVRGKGAMGVFCREGHDVDSDFQWYEFVVRDGYAAIRRADSAGHLDVLATTSKVDLPLGHRATIGGACVNDAKGRGQLWLTLDGHALLYASDPHPLGNGAPGLQAYDSPGKDAADRFLIRWHEFAVHQPSH